MHREIIVPLWLLSESLLINGFFLMSEILNYDLFYGLQGIAFPSGSSYIYIYMYIYIYLYISVFDKLIWCTIGSKSFLFGTAQFSLWASGTVNYDYIVTNSIKSSLIGSRCIPNAPHTDHFWANMAHASKLIKNSDVHAMYITCIYIQVYTVNTGSCL